MSTKVYRKKDLIMSIQYCFNCESYIDWDYDNDHHYDEQMNLICEERENDNAGMDN
jgi:hypothetical protein